MVSGFVGGAKEVGKEWGTNSEYVDVALAGAFVWRADADRERWIGPTRVHKADEEATNRIQISKTTKLKH